MAYDRDLGDRLKHLQLRKRRELAFIAKILFEKFEKLHAHKTNAILRNGCILKLALSGSHARGTQVGDKGSGYFSHYDLFIVVNNYSSTGPLLWDKAEDRLIREQIITKRIKAPVELIIHSYEDVNNHPAGRPFFMDIVRAGIALYEAKGRPFTKTGKMTQE